MLSLFGFAPAESYNLVSDIFAHLAGGLYPFDVA